MELLLLVEKEDKHVAGGGAAAAFKSKNYAKKAKEFKSLRESIRTGEDLEQLKKKEPAKMKWLTPKFLTKVLNMEDNNWIFDKLSELKQHPNIVALQDLCRIWGVANATAQKLINLGYSSIAALRALKNADGSDSTALRQLLAPPIATHATSMTLSESSPSHSRSSLGASTPPPSRPFPSPRFILNNMEARSSRQTWANFSKTLIVDLLEPY